MSDKSRLQFGSVIVEVVDDPENEKILMTVSKRAWDEDAVQIALPRHGAAALGELLRSREATR